MRSPPHRRIALVPVSADDRHVPGGGKVRRYALARVAMSPRSALGVNRHERLERIAAAERRRLDDRP